MVCSSVIFIILKEIWCTPAIPGQHLSEKSVLFTILRLGYVPKYGDPAWDAPDSLIPYHLPFEI